MPYRRDPDAVRRRIKEAAVHLFAHKGYAATATREIAEAAGVAKPALYYYFPDKSGLYVAIVREALDYLALSMEQAVAGAPDPVAALRALMETYLRFFAGNRDVAIVCFQEIFGLGERRLAELAPWYFERLRAQIDRLVVLGNKGRQLPAEVVQTVSLSLLGIPNIFVLRDLLHGGSIDTAAVAQRVVDYYLAEAGEPQPAGSASAR